MAYDEALAARLRAALASEPSLAEKRMFGGLAFMVEGAMTVAVMHDGALLARVGKDAAPALIATEGVEQMIMQGRPMGGWLRVAPEAVETDALLAAWVARCVGFVKTLDG